MLVFGVLIFCLFFFFKQKTAYEMRISDWSSDVCSSDLYVTSASRPRAAYSLSRTICRTRLRTAANELPISALALVPSAVQSDVWRLTLAASYLRMTSRDRKSVV